MTKRTYDIIAWCERSFKATLTIEADSPEDAIERARDGIHEADAEECDMGFHWDEFAVYDGTGMELLRVLDPEARFLASAAKLLAALQTVLPYAENEAEALQDLRYGDEIAGRQADEASSVVEQAQALIAELTFTKV